jgi:hypothetical protein
MRLDELVPHLRESIKQSPLEEASKMAAAVAAVGIPVTPETIGIAVQAMSAPSGSGGGGEPMGRVLEALTETKEGKEAVTKLIAEASEAGGVEKVLNRVAPHLPPDMKQMIEGMIEQAGGPEAVQAMLANSGGGDADILARLTGVAAAVRGGNNGNAHGGVGMGGRHGHDGNDDDAALRQAIAASLVPSSSSTSSSSSSSRSTQPIIPSMGSSNIPVAANVAAASGSSYSPRRAPSSVSAAGGSSSSSLRLPAGLNLPPDIVALLPMILPPGFRIPPDFVVPPGTSPADAIAMLAAMNGVDIPPEMMAILAAAATNNATPSSSSSSSSLPRRATSSAAAPSSGGNALPGGVVLSSDLSAADRAAILAAMGQPDPDGVAPGILSLFPSCLPFD